MENMVVGFKDPEKIYLIDFGLAVSFVDCNGNHIKKEYLQKFSGNFLFASLNSCRGYSKSRRDDVESLFYMLIFMLNKGYLPWCDLEYHERHLKQNFKEILTERMNLEFTKRLFFMIPNELTECLK